MRKWFLGIALAIVSVSAFATIHVVISTDSAQLPGYDPAQLWLEQGDNPNAAIEVAPSLNYGGQYDTTVNAFNGRVLNVAFGPMESIDFVCDPASGVGPNDLIVYKIVTANQYPGYACHVLEVIHSKTR